MPRPIPSSLESKRWPYADNATSAVDELGRRIAIYGRRDDTVTYSEVVRGIELRMPNVRGGAPFELGVPDWADLDRAILGELLGKLCLESIRRGDFLASAVVTSANEYKEPSEGFWALVRELGWFSSRDRDRRVLYWSDELRRAEEWYATNTW
jgi:hypothetical protein